MEVLMKKILSIILGIFILTFIIQFSSCKDDEGITEPQQVVVSLKGTIDFPFDQSELSSLTIGFGQKEYHPNSNGEFTITANKKVPGVAIVFNEEGVPNLMSLVPNPGRSQECKISVHSTAISLIFLNPFICTSNPTDAEEIVAQLEQLTELNQFEELLKNKLVSNPDVLSVDDSELQSALNLIIVAYINSVTTEVPKNLNKKHDIEEDDIIIDPGDMVSGHQVQHLGKNNFTISNWYGRWAKCIIPGDDLYLPPNGDLLDVLKWSPLWAPSQRDFEIEIIANDPPKIINVYGLGFSSESGIAWGDLTLEEQNHVLCAGFMTVLVEFVPRSISVLTNTSVTFGSGKIASDKAVKILGLVFNHIKIIEKARKYIADGDYSGFYWEMRKEYISLIVNDDEFRAKFVKALGVTFTSSALKTMASFALKSLKVLFFADDLTGLAKSVLALYSAGIKTTFKISSEEFKFGNVNGNVYDESTGIAIQGVKVQLLGDEDNPMNPNYIYITDAGGGFWFENIMVGKKSLAVSKEEYGGKTVEIDVKEKETIDVTITLSKEKGTLSGRVVNEIFMKNGITPINFNKECHLDITEIGGNNQSYAFWIYEQDNGDYSKSLTPGTYEITAWHEDYKQTTITVTIPGNEITQVEDLILKPDCKMNGHLYYNINFDNSYEYQYSFEATTSGETQINGIGECPDKSKRSALALVGFKDTEIIQILIDTSQIKESGYFSIGGIWNCGCAGHNGKSTVVALTKRFKCTHEETGYQGDLMFGYTDDPDMLPCNCGITNPGNIVLTKYGNKLADVIEGSINVTLAGWKGCSCSCCDDDGNHTVDCAKMQIDIKFKVLVGSLYDDMVPSQILNKMKGIR